MSINIKKAIMEFLKYIEKYDLADENIQRKKEHSLRVMNISETIARKLNLSEEEILIIAFIFDINFNVSFEIINFCPNKQDICIYRNVK